MEYAVLRLLHLLFGIVWAGGAIALGLFMIPASQDAGPAGGAVMRGIGERKLPILMQVSGAITVLVGLRLYQLRFSPSWVTTPEGIVLTLGGLLGIGALAIGIMGMAPTVKKAAALGQVIAKQGTPPTAEQGQQMAALLAKSKKLGALLGWHLLGATLLMSSMRLAQMLG